MISEFDALYEETRNAVDSWLGYQYQGKYALLRYLECLVEEYEKNKENPVVDNIKVCVEWIEDFIIFKDGKAVDQITGFVPENEIVKHLQNLL